MTDLLSLLHDIQQQSQKLLDCLKLEKQALDNNEFEQLSELAIQKQQLLDKLEQLDQQRATHCPDKNFSFFIENSRNLTLISQWEITRKVIADCQLQNETNGYLIARCSQINQDILSILSGRSQLQNETYNAQGNQTNSSSLLNGLKA